MWPWAHAAVGYLCYAAYCRYGGRRPAGPAALAVGLGTQLPDLIDKPLAWYLGVLPHGRSFAHSLVTGVPFVLAPLVVLCVARGRRDLGVALAVGYLSHLVGDGYAAALAGNWRGLGYLAWPLVPAPTDEVGGLFELLANVQGEPAFLFGLVVTAVGLVVWARQGTPGLGTVRAWALAVR
jgi:hypothetical protein